MGKFFSIFVPVILSAAFSAQAQSIRLPWSGYAHDAQHTAISPVASQPLERILWQTPVDLDPQYSGYELSIHYGSPVITRSNMVIVPVKTGAEEGFSLRAFTGRTGVTNWTQASDYLLPPHGWVPGFSPTLTPKNRLCFPGGGGTIFYSDNPDATNLPSFTRIAFYGVTNFLAASNSFLNSVYISTPVTTDRYGNIFFGFEVMGSFPLGLRSGIARIDRDGTGTWMAASNAASDTGISKVAQNCAPALSSNHKILYLAVNTTSYPADFGNPGYLLALDSRTLAPLAKVRLQDPRSAGDANVPDDGTASPVIGPDGDVFYGVLENPAGENNFRGWLLHFDGALTQTKIPGAFGWDDTPSIVPSSLVAAYKGASPYLVLVKYNSYVEAGGDGVNKLAILDPQNGTNNPAYGTNVMREIISIAGATPDTAYTNSYPNAVREWCINSAAVDPFTKSALVNNEDGKIYRWNFTSNTLSETNNLTAGIIEAYTPTLIGMDGIVYAINNGKLFAIGH